MSKGPYFPDQGDIVWLNLDPRVGHEQSGRRPVIVLSASLLTKHTGLAIVCPITSKIKGLPFEIIIDTKKTKGAILPIHIRSIDMSACQAEFIEKAPATVRRQTVLSVKVLIE